MTPRPAVLAACLLTLAIGACAGPDRADRPARPDDAEAGPIATPGEPAPEPAPPLDPLDPRDILAFAGDGSGPIDWEDLVALALGADIVLVGEIHGHSRGLAIAAELWREIVESGSPAALSLEFFERDHQLALDDYLAGVTDENEFRAASGRTSGNYPPGHRAMVELARDAGRPVVAANAPRRYVRLARTDGYDALGSLGDLQLAHFDFPDEIEGDPYRRRFERAMGVPDESAEEDEESPAHPAMTSHAMSPGMVDGFFRAQTLWDATMAASIARAAETSTPVLHVVGRFHIDRGTPLDGGLVGQLARRLQPETRVLTVIMVAAHDAALRPEDEGRADVVIFAGTPDRTERASR